MYVFSRRYQDSYNLTTNHYLLIENILKLKENSENRTLFVLLFFCYVKTYIA